MNLRYLSLDFIDALRRRRIHLNPYNQIKWFCGAYGTVKRTKQGGVPSRVRSVLAGFLFSELSKLKASTFDSKLKQIIQQTSDQTALSIGQAQKLCNMLIKYHIAYYFSGLDINWNRQNGWVKAIASKAHVPIDVQVLKNARSLYEKTFTGRVTTGYPKIQLTKHSRISYVWSKVPTYNPIQVLQGLFRQLAKSKGISPIELEMRELWRP